MNRRRNARFSPMFDLCEATPYSFSAGVRAVSP